MSKRHQEAVRKQFAKTVEAFSKYAVRDTPEVIAEKVEFVKPQPTDLALDVACGPGTFVLALAPRVHFARGIDLTEEMLRQARAFQLERQITNACFDCGEGEQLPYADGSFDLVFCQCSLHHMPKPVVVVKEMVRVTKADGRIIIIDTLGPESDAKFELHNRIESIRDPSHAESLRLTAFLEMFESLGLEIVRQTLKRRQRSFNQWMLRAGLEPKHKRYQEARKLLEESIEGDRTGFSPQPQGGDFVITHNEGMFILTRKSE
ncbi:MAG: methyltransferase domain-containing protein [Acidobacteria bacterium]|nr:methyltransferase domain-containing protein [Acidobacteriota bacterium]